jgi:predicted O-methyltransferase YrrM
VTVEEIASWAQQHGASQNRDEFALLLEILRKHKPQVILEIGCHNGTSLAAMKQAAEAELAIGIDPHILNPDHDQKHIITNNSTEFDLKIIPFFSQGGTTQDVLKSILSGRKVNFLFIDGDHSYSQVKYDHLTYLPHMATDGIVAFHDVKYHKDLWEVGVEVSLYWKKIKESHTNSYIEFVTPKGTGIGVLFR